MYRRKSFSSLLTLVKELHKNRNSIQELKPFRYKTETIKTVAYSSHTKRNYILRENAS